MELNRILVRSDRAPVIEIDPSCMSAYVRFKSGAKVVRTLEQTRYGVLANVDLDSKNQIIGVELIGVKEFSISAIVRLMPETARNVDFQKARFVPALYRESEMAQA